MKLSSSNQPIATCKSESCDDCMVNRNLHCHASPSDLPRFLLIICPTLVLGGAGVCQMDPGMLMPWLALLLGCFGFAALRGTGSSCLPGVARKRAAMSFPELDTLNMRNDPLDPISNRQKLLFFSGVGIAWGYPTCSLIYADQFFLLTAYLLSTASLLTTLRSFLCSRCIDFGCPMNAVDDYVRSDFYESNPGVARLWNRKSHSRNFIWRRMKINGLKKRTMLINGAQHGPDGTC